MAFTLVAVAAFAGGLSTAWLAQWRNAPPAQAVDLRSIAPPERVGGSAPSLGHRLGMIAGCESGGDPRAVSPDGRYRGKYQFNLRTWRTVGGVGDPAIASEHVQDRLARKLLQRRGTAPWPVCGAFATW
jgi:Transglycosylase-like domain